MNDVFQTKFIFSYEVCNWRENDGKPLENDF